MVMQVGVLALQGDWEAHLSALRDAGIPAEPVRTAAALDQAEALVLPGGESTAMLRLMADESLAERIGERVRSGMPVLATCAGVILLASSVEPRQPSLDLLDVDVVRNAYGRQVHSTVAMVDVDSSLGEPQQMEAVFIRAPRIVRTGSGVRVLGRRGGDPVLVSSGRVVAATFHPELGADRRVHGLFRRLLEDTDA
jgi:5'-phosphate synthase pdxT subunit